MQARLLFLLAVTVTAQPAVTEFAIERRVDLATTHGTRALQLPSDLGQGIVSGALEVRERLIFNPSGAALTSTLFAVQAGAPLPTPLNANLGGMTLGIYNLNVEKLQVTTRPSNSISFTGTVAGATAVSVLGNVAGLPFSVSLGFGEGTPTKATDVVHVMAGRIVAYSAEAEGTLVVPRPPAPPENPAGPQIVIAAPANTVSRQIGLDASGTTDDSGTSLAFTWRNVNKSAVILNPNTAVATIQFTEGPGDYLFELTVTNGNGQTAKKTITVTYFGR